MEVGSTKSVPVLGQGSGVDSWQLFLLDLRPVRTGRPSYSNDFRYLWQSRGPIKGLELIFFPIRRGLLWLWAESSWGDSVSEARCLTPSLRCHPELLCPAGISPLHWYFPAFFLHHFSRNTVFWFFDLPQSQQGRVFFTRQALEAS